MKPSSISRLIDILTTLQAGKRYAINDLTKIFGTSLCTIFRHLMELRAIGMPYYYDAQMNRYTV